MNLSIKVDNLDYLLSRDLFFKAYSEAYNQLFSSLDDELEYRVMVNYDYDEDCLIISAERYHDE
jgi:hypothetical protein